MNCYKILDISTNASKEEIRHAYKNLAKKYHPDKNSDSNYFVEINNAYHTLINDNNRKSYDKTINNNYPYEILIDLLNDFNKFTTFIKKIKSFNIITNITDLYLGKKNIIFYDDIVINYFPIKSLEINFEDEILKLESILVDNLNYEIKDYDVYVKIKLDELNKTEFNTFCYDLILPDNDIINIIIDKEEINNELILCYKKRGLPKIPIHDLFCNEKNREKTKNNNSYKRGNLYLNVKK